MGFENPDLPWRELERRLSGRPDPRSLPGDGGDSPAWSRKREAYVPVTERPRAATGRVAYGELHTHSSFSFLDGGSSPE